MKKDLDFLEDEMLYKLYDYIFGIKVGEDLFGNEYYSSKPNSKLHLRPLKRNVRWVRYKGAQDPTSVPVEWFGWLHHKTNEVPSGQNNGDISIPRAVNPTGSVLANYPSSYPMKNQDDEKSLPYQPWQPK